jgi:hypothetical protein
VGLAQIIEAQERGLLKGLHGFNEWCVGVAFRKGRAGWGSRAFEMWCWRFGALA